MTLLYNLIIPHNYVMSILYIRSSRLSHLILIYTHLYSSIPLSQLRRNLIKIITSPIKRSTPSTSSLNIRTSLF